MTKGVWLGAPDRKSPRTPAVFDRKIIWKKLGKTDEPHGGWQQNYSSIGEHAHLVEKQFEAEEAEGLMGHCTLRAAMLTYGDRLDIASTRAIAKKGRTDEVRVIYDGTHGLYLNIGIRVRDQVEFPTCADGKEVLSECSAGGGPHLSIHVDISKAHPRVSTLQEDLGRQGCQIKGSAAVAAREALALLAEESMRTQVTQGKQAGGAPRMRPRPEDPPDHILGKKVWLNKVGTFGVASAGSWW